MSEGLSKRWVCDIVMFRCGALGGTTAVFSMFLLSLESFNTLLHPNTCVRRCLLISAIMFGVPIMSTLDYANMPFGIDFVA